MAKSENPDQVKIGSEDQPKPHCPHCNAPLEAFVRDQSSFYFGRTMYVLSCPECRKVVSVVVL